MKTIHEWSWWTDMEGNLLRRFYVSKTCFNGDKYYRAQLVCLN